MQGSGGAVDAPPGRKPPMRQRLLDNKTGPQRLVISLGAARRRHFAIGGVVTAVARVFDGDGGGSDLDRAPSETQQIESRTEAANRFVSDLLDHNDAVVALDHHVIAKIGPADVSLLYNCTDTGVCSTVRIQSVYDDADVMPDGRWFKGCYAVSQDGNGYGADSLDIELRYQADTCV